MNLDFSINYRNPMSFLQYKAKEEDLKIRFAKLGLVVRVEPIDAADHYYTDGDSSVSFCKLIFTGGNTVYLPQLIYNVDPLHKKIIEEWILSIV
jgi:hypothetical protein